MSKINAIKTVVSEFTGGKTITDLGAAMRHEVQGYAQSINGKTVAANLGKYGLVPAVSITGAGAGVGLGSWFAGLGISNAFGLDFSNSEKSTESVKKLTGWGIAAALAVLGVVVLWPIIKKGIK